MSEIPEWTNEGELAEIKGTWRDPETGQLVLSTSTGAVSMEMRFPARGEESW